MLADSIALALQHPQRRPFEVLSSAPPSCLRRSGPVSSVSWSRNGRQLLSGSEDASVILWDVQQGKQVRVARGRAGRYSNSRVCVPACCDGVPHATPRRTTCTCLPHIPLPTCPQVLRLQLGSAVLRVSLHPRGPPFPALAALAEGPPVLLDLSAAAAAGGPQAQGEGGRTAVEPLPLVPGARQGGGRAAEEGTAGERRA